MSMSLALCLILLAVLKHPSIPPPLVKHEPICSSGIACVSFAGQDSHLSVAHPLRSFSKRQIMHLIGAQVVLSHMTLSYVFWHIACGDFLCTGTIVRYNYRKATKH